MISHPCHPLYPTLVGDPITLSVHFGVLQFALHIVFNDAASAQSAMCRKIKNMHMHTHEARKNSA